MQFFKTFLASLLGTFLALLILIIILFAAAVSSSSEPEPYIRSNTVLKMNLVGDIPMRAPDDPLQELLNPGAGAKVSVESIKNNLRKAAADENIEGVWIESNMVSASWANLQSVENILKSIKRAANSFILVPTISGIMRKLTIWPQLQTVSFRLPKPIFSLADLLLKLHFTGICSIKLVLNQKFSG